MLSWRTQSEKFLSHMSTMQNILSSGLEKKPKCLLDKYDGPNLYSTIGAIATELNNLPDTIQSKIDSEKVSVEVDFQKFKRNTEIEMQQLRIEYIDAFKRMKSAFTTSIGNLKAELD